MKGTLGLCLLLYIASSVKGAVITGEPEKDKVVTLGANAPALLTCTVDPAQTLTTFKWKKGNVDLCTAAAKGDPCTLTTDAAKSYAMDTTKHNLKVTGNVKYDHAGAYTCSIATPAESKPGDVTVVEANPTCPDASISIGTGTKKTITCNLSYKGTTQPGLKMTEPTGKVDVAGVKGAPDGTTGVIKVTASYVVPTTTATAERTYTCAATVGGKAHGTACTIKVTVYDNVIKAAPKTLYFAKIDAKKYQMPCTADAAKTYAQVAWYKGATKICTGKKTGKSDACTGYTIDVPTKHDLEIATIAETSAGAYKCNVEITANNEGAETHSTTLALMKDPICGGTWDGTSLKLNCSVEIKGTNTAPTITWTIKDKPEVIKGTTTKPPAGANWKRVDHTAIATDASTKIYVCHVKKDGVTDIATCEQGGASALSAKLFQSTLLAMVVVFVLNRFQ